jgi:hypothetical protein
LSILKFSADKRQQYYETVYRYLRAIDNYLSNKERIQMEQIEEARRKYIITQQLEEEESFVPEIVFEEEGGEE